MSLARVTKAAREVTKALKGVAGGVGRAPSRGSLDATLADMAKRNQLPKFEKVMADKTRKRRR